jgi:hypothetical protein
MKRDRPSHPRPSGTTLGHRGWDRKTQRRARPQCSRWKAPKRRPGGSIQTAENFLAGKGIVATLGAFRANRVFPCPQKPGTDGFVLPRFVPVPHGAVRKIHPRDIERYVQAVRLQTMRPEPNTIGFTTNPAPIHRCSNFIFSSCQQVLQLPLKLTQLCSTF